MAKQPKMDGPSTLQGQDTQLQNGGARWWGVVEGWGGGVWLEGMEQAEKKGLTHFLFLFFFPLGAFSFFFLVMVVFNLTFRGVTFINLLMAAVAIVTLNKLDDKRLPQDLNISLALFLRSQHRDIVRARRV